MQYLEGLINISKDRPQIYVPKFTFSFQNPSGWAGGGDDPWSLPKADGGCDVSSPYLWKYDVGTIP